MRIKVCLGLSFLLFLCLFVYGLYEKGQYKDMNQEKDILDRFAVGLLPDSLFDEYMERAETNLDACPIILAVKCLDTMDYRFRCTTQLVEVEHVFRGELAVGDQFHVARASSSIFLNEEDEFNDIPYINMGFVREMIPGETYLIFLERRIETFHEEKIYIQSQELLIAPIFCYSDITNQVCVSESDDVDDNSAMYASVRNNEFFLMSKESIERMEEFKQTLLEQYRY